MDPTWRIIPVSKWLITMVSKSPKDRVVGPLPNGLTPWLTNGGDPITTYKSWEDPPSMGYRFVSVSNLKLRFV